MTIAEAILEAGEVEGTAQTIVEAIGMVSGEDTSGMTIEQAIGVLPIGGGGSSSSTAEYYLGTAVGDEPSNQVPVVLMAYQFDNLDPESAELVDLTYDEDKQMYHATIDTAHAYTVGTSSSNWQNSTSVPPTLTLANGLDDESPVAMYQVENGVIVPTAGLYNVHLTYWQARLG